MILSDYTDIQLLETARNGDAQAFRVLVLRYQQKVATTVIGMWAIVPKPMMWDRKHLCVFFAP